jgi:DNA-directed RNA polymerase subunit H
MIGEYMKKFNLLEHELVPEHIILSEEGAEKVLERYHVTKRQLPKLKLSDPVVKQIKAKVGDIVKIVRNSQTAGEAVAYKVVIK